MAETPQTGEEQWPAVGAAYEFVLPSYQLLASRYEAADSRLTSLTTLASSLIVGLPVLARALQPEQSLESPVFQAVIVLLAIAAVVGIVGRQAGRLRLVDPMILFHKSLHRSEFEFKKNMLYFAGQSFADNKRTIESKSHMATAINGLVILALLIAAGWLFVAPR